jgi:hypothetical protein
VTKAAINARANSLLRHTPTRLVKAEEDLGAGLVDGSHLRGKKSIMTVCTQ